MSTFRAFQVSKNADDQFIRKIVERDVDQLPEGDVLIDVQYSSLNYKDALSATGNPGVTRNFPHTPGIDAAGTIVESASQNFKADDEVIVIGFDLGMNTSGGFGQKIRVPEGWVCTLPDGLSVRDSMVLGTAGFTAALCVDKLESAGMTAAAGPVLVTGATGGVGTVAVHLLATLGYEVHAVSGKADQADFLKSIGATEVHPREEFNEESARPLGRETWGGVVDTVGGPILANAIKSLKYGQSVAACGMVASPSFSSSVFPFILRHVNLLGIDSVELPRSAKQRIWSKLASEWKLDKLGELEHPLTLDSLSGAIDSILAGQMVGRGIVDLNA